MKEFIIESIVLTLIQFLVFVFLFVLFISIYGCEINNTDRDDEYNLFKKSYGGILGHHDNDNENKNKDNYR